MIKSIIALCEDEQLLDTIILPCTPMYPVDMMNNLKKKAQERKEQFSKEYKNLQIKYYWDYGDLELRIYGTKKS